MRCWHRPGSCTRPDRLYLSDIVEATQAIQRFLSDVTAEEFRVNEILQSAVLQKLIVVGEAACRLSLDLCDRHPEVDWRGIVGFRNIAVHAYFSVDWSIVWVAATDEASDLGRQVGEILTREFPEEDSVGGTIL